MGHVTVLYNLCVWAQLGRSQPSISCLHTLNTCVPGLYMSEKVKRPRHVAVPLQGASAQLRRAYFPNADIWFAEHDAACVKQHADALRGLNISVVIGDQGDNNTLASWVQQTGGNFDVIIVSRLGARGQTRRQQQ